MDLTRFEALTFDCYGTLIDWETGLLQALRPWIERQGVSVDDEDLLALFAGAESRAQAKHPHWPYPRILEAVLGEIAGGLGAAAGDAERAAFGASVRLWPPFPDSGPALASLQERYRLVVVSNIDSASFAASEEALGITFDEVVTAEEAGCYKPDPGIFRMAFRRIESLGVPRRKIVHVAQSLVHDHVPAKALGLRTVWVNRRKGRAGWGATPAPAQKVVPDLVVDSLAELAAMACAAWSAGKP